MIGEILAVMLAAVWAEHAALYKFFGVQPFRLAAEKPRAALAACAAAMLMTSAALAAASLIFAHGYLRITAFVVLMAGFIWLANIAAQKYAPDSGVFLLLMLVNCTAASAVFAGLSDYSEYSGLARGALYGAATAAGLTAAVIMFTGLRERLVFAAPPKILKGAPIALAAAGLAAMALTGLRVGSVAQLLAELLGG